MKDPALFWEIFAFGFSYLGTVTWMGALLVFGNKDHARRLQALEHSLTEVREKDLADLREKLSRVEGAQEIKAVVREWLSTIQHLAGGEGKSDG